MGKKFFCIYFPSYLESTLKDLCDIVKKIATSRYNSNYCTKCLQVIKKYLLVIQIEVRGHEYGTEWMDRLTESFWTSLCLTTLLSHRCTNPVG